MHPPHSALAHSIYYITLFEKKYLVMSLVHLAFMNLQECPLVPLQFTYNTNSSCSATELYPLYILKTSMRSYRFRRSSSVHSLKHFKNLSSYVLSRISLIILVYMLYSFQLLLIIRIPCTVAILNMWPNQDLIQV